MAESGVKQPGGTHVISTEALRRLRSGIRGTLQLPGDPGYDEARSIWNAMIDRRPAVVVRAADTSDVVQAVTIAREFRLPLSIRGGGHNIAGNAVCEGGLMLNLSGMKSVRVDPQTRTARVEPGATLADFDGEAQTFGLATPLGINSTTGVAGLTLGGGFGWLSRKYGLTVDNLLSADLVTADGARVRASATDHPDLFWAIRGGGGNFGVVTSFEYQLHPVGPEVLSGLIVHPLADGAHLLRQYRDLVAQAPDELTCWIVMRKAPPLPFLPADVHGKEILVLALCYSGDIAEGMRAAAPFRTLGTPIADVVGPQPYVSWQTTFDPLLAPGARNYWKSHDFTRLEDRALDVLLEYTNRLPSPECEVFIGHLGGAVNRVAADATAYPHRNVEFVVNVHTRWSSPDHDAGCVSWARSLFQDLTPYATGGVYVNFMPEDEKERVSAGAYGVNYKRLAQIKAKYDPENLFCTNQNIKPSAQ